MSANTNMDPQTPTLELEPQILPIQRLSSPWTHSADISQHDLFFLPPSPLPTDAEEMPVADRTATKSRKVVQPPRPPNAWILYRSDKLRELPPPVPGENRTQADVSKAISAKWKGETEETRAEYERRADAKKAEHQRMYPGYRFQPMKKEEKERLRAERKQEKDLERLARQNRGKAPVLPATASGMLPPPLPHPLFPFFLAEARFGPAGPSPPLSAASSPNDASPCPDSQYGDEPQSSQSSHASPYPELRSLNDFSSASTIPIYNAQTATSQSQQYSSTSSSSSISPPGSSQWQPQQLLQQEPVPFSSATSAPQWNPYRTPPESDNSVSSDFVSFDIQPLAIQSMQLWATNDAQGFEESMRALLSSTGDPSIFQLDNFDLDSLNANPTGEIEVSMGEIPSPFDPSEFIPDFSAFDFGPVAGPSSFQLYPPDSAGGGSSTDESLDFASFFTAGGQSVSKDFNNYNADEYIDFGDTTLIPPESQSSNAQQSLFVEQPTPVTQQPAPYTPPAGAALTSNRRVAGSWKHSFVTSDSSIDLSPPHPWSVPAT